MPCWPSAIGRMECTGRRRPSGVALAGLQGDIRVLCGRIRDFLCGRIMALSAAESFPAVEGRWGEVNAAAPRTILPALNRIFDCCQVDKLMSVLGQVRSVVYRA